MHLPRALALAALIGLGSISCNKGETPEQRVRALIVDAEQAVEKKEIANVRDYVSARYRDDEQRDRRAIEGILRLYLLRHESINLYTRIESIIPTQADHAEAVVYVAMAARPIKRVDELSSYNATLYRFELGFAQEQDQWRVVRAAWRPAELIDFVR